MCTHAQCVDWADAGETRQAAELMAGWATIDTADALELLSPAFKSEEVSHCQAMTTGSRRLEQEKKMLIGAAQGGVPGKPARCPTPPYTFLVHQHTPCTTPAPTQVRSHAVSVLQQKDDDELLSFLLQLVQVGGAGCEQSGSAQGVPCPVCLMRRWHEPT